MRGQGFLAIWSDITTEHETDYLHWLAREHTAERISVPGFLAVRVFRTLREDVRRYFILYELQTTAVVDAPAYLRRLDDPTPWTRRIMPLLGNFVRGGGRVVESTTTTQGSFVLPVRLRAPLPVSPEQARRTLLDIAMLDRIAAVRLLETDQVRTAIATSEKSIRAKDDSFAALLLIEALDAAALPAAVACLAPWSDVCIDLAADAGRPYAQVFGLSEGMMAKRS